MTPRKRKASITANGSTSSSGCLQLLVTITATFISRGADDVEPLEPEAATAACTGHARRKFEKCHKHPQNKRYVRLKHRRKRGNLKVKKTGLSPWLHRLSPPPIRERRPRREVGRIRRTARSAIYSIKKNPYRGRAVNRMSF